MELYPALDEPYYGRGLAKGLKGEVEGAVADIYAGLEVTAAAGADPAGGVRDADDAVSRMLADLTRLIKHHPSRARAYEVRGVVRLISGNEPEAERDFRRCKELDPALKAEVEKAARAVRARGSRPGGTPPK